MRLTTISSDRRDGHLRIGLVLALAAAWWTSGVCTGRAADVEVGEDGGACAPTVSVTSRSAATGGAGISRAADVDVDVGGDAGARDARAPATSRFVATAGTGIGRAAHVDVREGRGTDDARASVTDRSTATSGTGAASTARKSSSAGDRGGPCGHAGDAEKGPVAGITAAHNAARCRVGTNPALPPLRWSAALAAVAQRYADQLASKGCRLVHSSGPYGENLFWGTESYTPKDVVAAWLREEKCFTHTTFPDSCSCTCGHYTQMVWRGTVRLGCGLGRCARVGELWVCNYDPPGNVIGKPVY